MKIEKMSQEGGLSRRAAASGGSEEFESWALTGHSHWRLPSGEGLAEFALHAGLVAPSLLAAGFGRPLQREKARRRTAVRAPEETVSAGGRK